MPYYNSAYKTATQTNLLVKGPKPKTEDSNKLNDPNNMNNNIMFRSMFFMNDEPPRHFLAPHIAPLDNESEYFQRKPATTSGSSQQNVSSQTQTGEPIIVNKLPVQYKQRPHTCEECGKSFLLKHHLATHIRVHTGERPHVCPECGKTFALKHCLSTHLLLHSAERPYKCNECNKSFTLKHHLVRRLLIEFYYIFLEAMKYIFFCFRLAMKKCILEIDPLNVENVDKHFHRKDI